MKEHRSANPLNAPAEARKHEPLVQRLREIRTKHDISQLDLAACMNLPDQAIKKIEEGIQQLPGVQAGAGPSLRQWLQAWYRCVEVLPAERDEIDNLLMLMIFGEVQRRLP
jgi:transcriptional regulator with XRE-family HTH domain